MKYLLFNVVVVAALVYLFVGGGPTDPVEEWLPDHVNTVIADVRERVSPRTSGKEPVVAPPAIESSKQTLPTTAAVDPAANTVPQVIEVPERLAPFRILPTTVGTRQPTRTAPIAEPLPQVDGPLMSPRERRRELQRLAESMEMFAVEKITR